MAKNLNLPGTQLTQMYSIILNELKTKKSVPSGALRKSVFSKISCPLDQEQSYMYRYYKALKLIQMTGMGIKTRIGNKTIFVSTWSLDLTKQENLLSL